MNDSDRSAGLWLLSFAATAGATLCDRFGWLPALLGGGLAAFAYRLRMGRGRLPGAVRILQTLWLAVPLSISANAARVLFPEGVRTLYVPAVVLGLAWLLCRHGRSGVLSCCVISGFFVLCALGVISAFSLPDLRLCWLRPSFSCRETMIALSACTGGMFLSESIPGIRPGSGWRWAAALAPMLLSAIVSGCLSRPLAARQTSAFYTLSRAVSLFGVAERFEALIAACLTLGLCSACALLLCAASGGIGIRTMLVLTALLLTAAQIPEQVCAAGTVLLWQVLPAVFAKKSGKSNARKKFKKSEKSS